MQKKNTIANAIGGFKSFKISQTFLGRIMTKDTKTQTTEQQYFIHVNKKKG